MDASIVLIGQLFYDKSALLWLVSYYMDKSSIVIGHKVLHHFLLPQRCQRWFLIGQLTNSVPLFPLYQVRSCFDTLLDLYLWLANSTFSGSAPDWSAIRLCTSVWLIQLCQGRLLTGRLLDRQFTSVWPTQLSQGRLLTDRLLDSVQSSPAGGSPLVPAIYGLFNPVLLL